jgi:hypothetical protein
VTVAIGPENGYRLDPDAVAAAITPRTRAICLVDPSNPYGTLATDDEVAALTALAERHGCCSSTTSPTACWPSSPGAPPVAAPAGEHAVATFSVSHCFGMAGARMGFLGGPPALMRGCLQLKAALTRLNTNLVSQRGALAALCDGAYRHGAETAIRANLAHLEQTLDAIDGVDLAVAPRRGLACALELDDGRAVGAGADGRALRAARGRLPRRRLGDQRAATTVRLNLSGPRWAMEHLRSVLGEALDERLRGAGANRSRRCSTARAPPARPRWRNGSGAADDHGRAHGRARIAALAGRSRSRPHAPARVPRRVAARVAGRRGRLLVQDQPAAGHPARAGVRRRGSRGGVRGRVRAGARRHRRGGARRVVNGPVKPDALLERAAADGALVIVDSVPS